MRGHIAKKGKYYYAVIYEGVDPATGKDRHRWHAAGPRRTDAERLVNDLVKRKHQGEDATTDRSTLASYLTDRWLPIQKSRLRPSTYLSYRSNVLLHVVPYIGRIRLDKLQPADLDGLYVDLLRTGRRRGAGDGLSATTVRYVHRVLAKALADAHRKGIVARNVAELADPPKAEATGTKSKMHVWDATELRRFLAVTTEHQWYLLWLLAARTGMRRGELLGLQWHDLDPDRATVSVRRAFVVVGGHPHLSDVKTSSSRRTIDLDRHTTKVLESRMIESQATAAAAGDTFGRGGLIFAASDGGPTHPELVSRAFNRLVTKHTLPRIRFHDIRHTHATLLLKAGVPAKVVAERLGHATPGFTLNVYQHVLPGMQAEAANVFDRLLADPDAPPD